MKKAWQGDTASQQLRDSAGWPVKDAKNLCVNRRAEDGEAIWAQSKAHNRSDTRGYREDLQRSTAFKSAASRPRLLTDKFQGNELWLEGGAEQLVVNPKDLSREHLSPREFTGWSYDSFDVEVGLVGVPILQTNWRP